MIKKINLGDLILDYSEEGVENVGYVYDINVDNEYSRNITYGIFWLNPNPGTGDYYSIKEINKWITDGTWKYLPVRKDERKTKK